MSFDPLGKFSLLDHTPPPAFLTYAAFSRHKPHSADMSFDPLDKFSLLDHTPPPAFLTRKTSSPS